MTNVLGGRAPRATQAKAGCRGTLLTRVDARLSGALNMLSLMRKVVGAATEDDEEVCTSRCLHPDPTPGQDSR